MYKEWCGKACSECKTSCAADKSIPCSPNCGNINEDGSPFNLRDCLESGCDAIVCIEKIQDAVTAESKAYKQKITGMSSSEVYNEAHDIHLVEEMVYLICDCSENFEDDTNILWILYNLSLKGEFLNEYLKWSYTLDSIDVSNVGKTYDTLKDFCDYCSEETA